MRRLILFRHAKTAPRAPGQRDINRALTDRGIADSQAMATRLARDGLVPDLVLISPAVRTRQTWDHAKAAFPEANSEVVNAIYEAEIEDIAAIVSAHAARTDTLMVIGHNPGLQDYAVDRAAEGGDAAHHVDQLEARFPTAAAAAFLIDENGRASFDGLFTPKDYLLGDPI